MPTKPTWTDLPGKYVSPGRRKVVGIVLHDTAGSGTHGDTKYLANPSDGRKVCCDFTVERNGSIWKLNPDLDKFYTPHAGRNTKFKGLANRQVTQSTIGIEICQHVNLSLSPVYTPAQVKATAELCAWLVQVYGLTTSDITTHRQVITDGSRSDPRQFPFEGAGGFWQYYWEFLGKKEEYETSEIMPKVPEVVAAKVTHNVSTGDTLSSIAKKYYGKASEWKKISKANNLKNETIIPGQVLIIPQ